MIQMWKRFLCTMFKRRCRPVEFVGHFICPRCLREFTPVEFCGITDWHLPLEEDDE